MCTVGAPPRSFAPVLTPVGSRAGAVATGNLSVAVADGDEPAESERVRSTGFECRSLSGFIRDVVVSPGPPADGHGRSDTAGRHGRSARHWWHYWFDHWHK
jgi:hypothetical protein